jgi:triacylglycerol lipase
MFSLTPLRQLLTQMTQMPIEIYPGDATKDFKAVDGFDLGTARAMAWMSQLAYETDQDKIKAICRKLDIALVGDRIHRSVNTGLLPIASTEAIVLDLGAVVVVSFAGTNPGSLANWVSDFDIKAGDGGAAEGFAVAVQVAFDDIKNRLPANRRLMITGHSLGGALAVLLAQKLAGQDIAAVYTFGMPRPGRSSFTGRYNQSPLSGRTYRLVHGDDIVPTVAPAALGFGHVGRYVPTPRGGIFQAPVGEIGTNEPNFVPGTARELRASFDSFIGQLGAFASQLDSAAQTFLGSPAPGKRSDVAGIMIELLPPRVRDHWPDRYIAACSP